MTKDEQQQLSKLVAELEDIQAVSPAKTTYTKGRTSGSISIRLLEVIRDLKVLGDINDEPAIEPAG